MLGDLDKFGIGMGIRVNLGQMTEAFTFLGDFDEAEELLSDVEDRCNQVQDGIGIAWTMKWKSQLLKTQGRIKEGTILIMSGIQKLREIGNENIIAHFEFALGPIYLPLFNTLS